MAVVDLTLLERRLGSEKGSRDRCRLDHEKVAQHPDPHQNRVFGKRKQESGFRHSAIQAEGVKTLSEGDGVELDVVQGERGPKAENVRKFPHV